MLDRGEGEKRRLVTGQRRKKEGDVLSALPIVLTKNSLRD